MRPSAYLTALSSLAFFGVVSTASAQPGQPFPPAPGGAPAGTAPAPGAPAAPPAAPPGAAPAPAPAPASPGPGGFGFGFGADANGAKASGTATAPAPAKPSASAIDEDRNTSLYEMPTLSGSTGLLRVASARSAPVGTFRLQVLWEYFSGSDFLCNTATRCTNTVSGNGVADKASRFGANFLASGTVLPFLEGYVGIRSYATSNDAGRPGLLQVLGDTTVGAKLFLPAEPYRLFNFGGDIQLLLLNGTGGVGLNGSGTSFRIRGDVTTDFRKPDGGAPLLAHLNLGYKVDNSGKLVQGTEEARGNRPITRIERFGLGINRVDQFEIGLGLEGVFKTGETIRFVRPFAEYTVEVPVNRQKYACDPNTKFSGDECLGQHAEYGYIPSRVSLGARANPFLKGLTATFAVDIGLSGTSKFLEEVAPNTPWTVWWGLGYAADVVEKPPVVVEKVGPERVVMTPPPPQRLANGLVHENGKADGVPNAIVRYDARPDLTGMVTDATGHFKTSNLEPGQYTFSVKADGYKDGTCSVTIAAGAPTPAAPPTTDPANTMPGAAPGAPGAPGAPAPGVAGSGMPGSTDATNPAAQQTFITDVDCSLEALPRVGNVSGKVGAAEGGMGIANASVAITDAQGKTRTITTDGSGNFKAEGLPPGTAKFVVTSDEYLGASGTVDIKARDTASASITLNKRPKNPNVTITKTEIQIKQQVHFENDSAKIQSDSAVLLEELADAINRNPKIKQIEIQGHTDNSGTPQRNKVLSDERANAVRDRLVTLGVSPSRMVAKGYGSDQPIAPNFGPGKARNRRVALKILEQDK